MQRPSGYAEASTAARWRSELKHNAPKALKQAETPAFREHDARLEGENDPWWSRKTLRPRAGFLLRVALHGIGRLLEPKDFGLVGMSQRSRSFDAIPDFGLSSAAVQRTTVTEEQFQHCSGSIC